MKRSIILCALLAVSTVSQAIPRAETAAPVAPQVSAAAGSPEQYRTLVTTYCAGCHGATKPAAGLALSGMNFDAITTDAPVWEKVVRKLRGRLMPPPGSKQPEQKEIDSLVGWLETRLDANAGIPKAGHTPIQRMSRTEYIAAVKALVGVDIKNKDILPTDVSVEGFDNIAVGLSVSPAFVEQYVEAARQVAKTAVGDPSLDAIEYVAGTNQGGEAMPLGLRSGAMRIRHEFTADGEYRFKVHFPDLTLGLYTGSLENPATVVILVDGKVMFKKPIGGVDDVMLNHRKAGDGRQQIQDRFDKQVLQIQAGTREVVVGFIDRSRFESAATFSGGGGGGQPNFDLVEIKGPYKPNGATTVSHRLIFVCDPKVAGEAPCSKQIAENLARRAFRRPVTDTDIARLMPFYEAGRKEEGATFDRGVERLVAAVLASPEFLYRTIRGTEVAKAGAEVTISDYELATRLSFFVWNTGPDEELFKLAASKELGKPAVLDAQVKRMLADPRANSLVSSFAMKWLGLTGLETMKPDQQIFTGFGPNDRLKKDLVTEAETFITSVMLENKPLVELLTSDRTYLNESIARHYGLTGITGPQFRWVQLTDKNRIGLLGKGGILIATSYPNRTSPVLRGAWILDRIIGTPPTPPPPGVETDLTARQGEAPKTVRARLEQHRDNATCRQCHGVIDPMGLALENFDAVGQFRTTDRQAANAPIDASTVLPSGQPLNGPVELREYLASNPAKFAQAFTEKLMMYAVNRELEYFDMPQVRGVIRSAAKDNYTLSSIVQGIVQSDAFRKQGPAHAKPAGTKVADNK